jgi:exonuclease V
VAKTLSVLEASSTDPIDPDSDLLDDSRSPLLRFRSFPKKPFSVTDMTAGAWCELQYLYTLSRLPWGRRTRTPAMQTGVNLHQKLENEVHSTVEVEVASREDKFGLKVWNVIQGLRNLREAGLTRELEVWGMIDGQVMSGIIDGVSYTKPIVEDKNGKPEKGEKDKQEKGPLQDQHAITEFFSTPTPTAINPPQKEGKIYLTDVKTRGSLKSPITPALLRPAKVQLFLYHRFLSDMASFQVDYTRIFRRYGLDADELFSDSFMAHMGGLTDELFSDGDADPASSPNVNSSDHVSHGEGDEIGQLQSPGLKYATLRALVPLLNEEIRLTFPMGRESIGDILSVEYRYSKDLSLITSKVFPVNSRALDIFLAKQMEWWKGDRQPSGVVIEEAYKCRLCDFADDCSWRKGIEEERLRYAREKIEAARMKKAQE